jgi:hypothetical protein
MILSIIKLIHLLLFMGSHQSGQTSMESSESDDELYSCITKSSSNNDSHVADGTDKYLRME